MPFIKELPYSKAQTPGRVKVTQFLVKTETINKMKVFMPSAEAPLSAVFAHIFFLMFLLSVPRKPPT